MTTDRPDTTESPFTVDAGHVQVETTLLGYTLGRRAPDGSRPEQLDFAVTNVRIGLTSRLELDLGFQPYGFVDDGGPSRRTGGSSSIDLRAKYNVWGNDGGSSAFALLPFISIPVDRSSGLGPDDVEFGVLAPLALELNDRLGLGINSGLTVRRNRPDGAYRVSVPVTASLAVAWPGDIGTYYEVAADFGQDSEVTLNSGITWLIAPSLQLDAGVIVGVTRAAPALALFTGFSVRF